jgi:hypothetical protein
MKSISFLRKPVGFEGRFTQIPNSWARDERLGYRARGILLLLMSHQDGWKITLEHLANDGPDGITSVRTAIAQLQESGYLTRNVIRNGNRIEGSEWIISDPFEKETPKEDLSSDFLTLENLTSENLTSENLTLKKTIDIEHYKKENYMLDFEKFWEVYPRKVGKGAALTSFKKAVKKTEASVIIGAVIDYVQSGKMPDMQYIPYPATWLNQERWNDDLNAVASKRNSTTIAADIINRSTQLGEFGRREIE